MKYLKRFWTTLTDCFHKESGVKKQLCDQEFLARFITSKRWYSIQKSIVKPQAFMPPPNLQLSIFRIKDLKDPEIWEIGIKQVFEKMKQPKNLHGRADIKAVDIFDVDLQIEPDNPPPRHANIINWPDQKEKVKSIAQELAAKASLRLNR